MTKFLHTTSPNKSKTADGDHTELHKMLLSLTRWIYLHTV